MFDLIKQKFTYRLTLPLLLLLCALVWLTILVFPSNRPKIIFCNVGQGDATLIIQGFHQILIDGGPDSSVLACLSKHMPFFDKKIDIVALTHADTDHFGGLIYVMDRYKIDYFLSNGIGNSNNPAYKELLKKSNDKIQIHKSNMKLKTLNTGDSISFGNMQMKVLWPEKRWVEERVTLVVGDRLSVIGNQKAVENSNQKAINNQQLTTTFSLNSFGLVFLVSSLTPNTQSLNTFLLMADVDSTIQDELIKTNPNISKVDILKFPHHGSKTGISEAFLQRIMPKEAVISVGKNTFGHPSKEALDMLTKYGISIQRTDQLGDIVYKL